MFPEKNIPKCFGVSEDFSFTALKLVFFAAASTSSSQGDPGNSAALLIPSI